MVQVVQSRMLLRPSDFGASLLFYEEQLGLVRYREWGEEPHRGVVFFLGGGYLELTESSSTDVRTDGIRLWLQGPDLEAAVAELRDAGVSIDEQPEQKPWGLIESTIHDPDGLEIVLIETPITHPLRRRQ
ncbi:MAG: VOC family protein [Nitriliruptorales bacterium]|nr:VOC family protein [Nitriliruptorales bacterium]